jgi:hypothetical protein
LSTPRIPNSELAEQFAGLFRLASGYVNGAWDYTHGSAEAAVQAFIEDQDADMRASAAAGIDALFVSCSDEPSRRDVLNGWGWNYGGAPGALDAFLTWARASLVEAA